MMPSLGVTKEHVGQIVDTAGWVRIVWAADPSRYAKTFKDDMLPPGLRFILGGVDDRQRAFLYRDDTGVIMVPCTLVDPWSR